MIWILFKLIFKIYFTGQPQFPSLLSSHLLPYPPPIYPLLRKDEASHGSQQCMTYDRDSSVVLFIEGDWALVECIMGTSSH